MDKGKQALEGLWEVFQMKMALESHIQKERLKGHTPSEIHCIQYVGDHSDSNVTRLASAFQMTTGGVTKLTKKLLEKGLLEAYKSPDNRKEVYFRLTPEGQAVYRIHEQLNREFDERDKPVLEHFSEGEYDCLLHFITLYNQHLSRELQKLHIDITSGIADKL